MRRAARRLGLAAVAALLSAACSDSLPASPPPARVQVPVTSVPTARPERFEISSFEVAAVEAVPGSLRSRVEEGLDRYLTKAVLEPLRTGDSDRELSDVFTSRVKDRIAGPDRAALVDDVGRRAAGVVVEKASAAVSVLAGRGGEGGGGAGLASVRIDLRVRATVGLVALTIERSGELFLIPDGDSWKVTGYAVQAKKESTDTSTTTSSSTSATAGP